MPIEFRCCQCQKLLQTPDETAGKQAKCPQCGTIQQIPSPAASPDAASLAPPGSPFASGVPSLGPAYPDSSGGPSGEGNPYRSPSDYGSTSAPWADAGYLRRYAEDRVNTPATMLLVVGVIGLALNLIGMAFNVLSLAVPNMGGGAGMQGLLLSGGIGVLGGLLGAALATVVIVGGLKMQRLESRGWATAAAIVAVVPCLSPCCLLGFPFGIWALVVLNDPQVRSAFRA